MSMRTPISRRTVLRGLGAAVALPWLESMAPGLARASQTSQGSAAPLRLAFFYVPNGVHMPAWRPDKVGGDIQLPATLTPLERFKEELLVLSGLAQDNAHAKGDGPGDHARSLACFLTGTHPRKTDGANIRAGVSVDQVAAQQVGYRTRFPSLELGIERGAQSGNCDSGYSCAYSSNISWRSESVPMAKEINPRLVFERLFASEDPSQAAEGRGRRQRYKRSILDFVAEDASQLKSRLGVGDQRKMDEYLMALRELEVRIAALDNPVKVELPEGYTRPTGIPKDYQEHIRLMFDLLALAFQTDVTRIATFMYANEGSNRSYAFLGAPEGHHDLSHHGNDPEKHEKLAKINAFHIEQFAYFLDRLKASPEGESNVLDNSLIVYGSGISDGNQHNHNDLPVLLAGKGGGTIKSGRHVAYPENTPLNNLYLSILDRMGTPVDALGDSTGRLNSLEA